MKESVGPTSWWTRGLASLGNPNLRRYLVGQGVSQTGGWLQLTAELWLILEIAGSGAALGLHSVLRFGPILLFGAYGGLITDRVERFRLLKLTQAIQAALTSLLAASLWVTTSPPLTFVYAIVLVQGFVNAVDNPLRRGFVRDLASNEELPKAVALNSTMVTVTRTVGPAVAGVLIAAFGVVWCFTINAASYLAVLAALRLIDRTKLRPTTLAPAGRGQVRAGLVYAWKDPEIRTLLGVATVVGTFAWNYSVLMPVYATTTLGGDASLYGLLLSVVGVGSFVGAIVTSRTVGIDKHRMRWSLVVLSVGLLMAAAAPNIAAGISAMFVVGAAGTSIIVSTQSRLQVGSTDLMSGRVMALYTVGFVGSKPVGGALGGWLMDVSGPRLAWVVGAVAVMGAFVWLTAYARAAR